MLMTGSMVNSVTTRYFLELVVVDVSSIFSLIGSFLNNSWPSSVALIAEVMNSLIGSLAATCAVHLLLAAFFSNGSARIVLESFFWGCRVKSFGSLLAYGGKGTGWVMISNSIKAPLPFILKLSFQALFKLSV